LSINLRTVDVRLNVVKAICVIDVGLNNVEIKIQKRLKSENVGKIKIVTFDKSNVKNLRECSC